MTPEQLNGFINSHDVGAKGYGAEWPSPVPTPARSGPERSHQTTEGARRAFAELLEAIPPEAATPCAADPDTWTAETPTPEQRDRARRGCARCPVAQQCAAYARLIRPTCGIWAGDVYRRDGHPNGRYRGAHTREEETRRPAA